MASEPYDSPTPLFFDLRFGFCWETERDCLSPLSCLGRRDDLDLRASLPPVGLVAILLVFSTELVNLFFFAYDARAS